MPNAQACDHPCYDMAKGDRLLKDVYEGLRAGKAWEKTMLVVVYDDSGGWYDQVSMTAIFAAHHACILEPTALPYSVQFTTCTRTWCSAVQIVPPFAPNDEAPCNVNLTSKCGDEAAFDFRRLGQRSAAMLISPLVPKGAVLQHPSCSAEFRRQGDQVGVGAAGCADGGKSRGNDHGGAQFEHSSLSATIKYSLARSLVISYLLYNVLMKSSLDTGRSLTSQTS
jgi:hypothetical protein